jgi:hypothetical protein
MGRWYVLNYCEAGEDQIPYCGIAGTAKRSVCPSSSRLIPIDCNGYSDDVQSFVNVIIMAYIVEI